MPPTPYRIDLARLSWRELFAISSVAGLPAAIAIRLLGRPRPAGAPLFRIDASPAVDPARVPADVRETLADPIARCERLGLAFRGWFTAPSSGADQGWGAAASDEGGRVAATVSHVSVQVAGIARRRTNVWFATKLADGRVLTTADRRPSFLPPPGYVPAGFPGLSIEDLLARHRDRVARAGPPASIPPAGLEAERVRANNALVDSLVARGIATTCEASSGRSSPAS